LVRAVYASPADVLTIGRAIAAEVQEVGGAFQGQTAYGDDAQGSVGRFEMEVDPPVRPGTVTSAGALLTVATGSDESIRSGDELA
jgi:hypothetical protein